MGNVRLKMPAKLAIVALVMVGIYFGGPNLLGLIKKFIPVPSAKIDTAGFKDSSGKEAETINVGVVTWGGYAGGEYFNNGFKASPSSRFYSKCGIGVNFIVLDDFEASRSAWKSDKVQVMWITADSFPTEAGSLSKYQPKIFFQSDWSRGGDAIVSNTSITSTTQLRGKKVAVAMGTPSHTFLLSMLNASDISPDEIVVVETGSAIDAAKMYAAGKVDAAVVWSPDDADLVAKVANTHVLVSTKTATNIIADVFYAKQDYINSHKKELTCIVEGWLTGAAEINTKAEAKTKATDILVEGLGVDKDFVNTAISNARLTTYGDNLNFFEMNLSYKGVTGNTLYTKMTKLYKGIGLIDNAPTWNEVVDTSIIRNVNLPNSGIHAAEGKTLFTKLTDNQASNAKQLSEMRLSVYFDTGSSELDQTSKMTIKTKFVQIAKENAGSSLRISGNTDDTGNYNQNVALSKARADSVKRYLVAQGIDAARIHTYGNGPDKPVADNNSPDGREQNRRTDFELVN